MGEWLIAQKPAPLSVSQINQQARQILERNFTAVWVTGEVSNYKVVSGHAYFSLKDASAQLPAVLFRREVDSLDFRIKDGMQIVIRGRLTVYAPYGRYQIVCDKAEPVGSGALQQAFNEIKGRLLAEGLFAPEKKRSLPLLPGRIAVVTSPTGAVIRDIIHVAQRRFPNFDLLVIPSKVQGVAAVSELLSALRQAHQLASQGAFDVLMITRGGGSLEDLWCFNDEQVARAIADFPVPTITGIGHETDFTIADFVADVRAPTPSAAAELVFPSMGDLRHRLQQLLLRTKQGTRRQLLHLRQRIFATAQIIAGTKSRLRDIYQQLVTSRGHLESLIKQIIHQRLLRVRELHLHLTRSHPQTKLTKFHQIFFRYNERLRLVSRAVVERQRRRLETVAGRLSALSPLAVLERGYSIVMDRQGRIVKDAAQRVVGEELSVRLLRGQLGVTVQQVVPHEKR